MTRLPSWTAPLYRSYKLEAQARESLKLKDTRSRFVLVFVGFRIQSGAVQIDSVGRRSILEPLYTFCV